MRRILSCKWHKSLTLVTVACAAVLLGTSTVGALAAFSATIGQNGTLGAASIVLGEDSGSENCYSTSGTNTPFTANSAFCSTIDKFGAPTGQVPGGPANTQTLSFTNLGSAYASSFTIVAGPCSVAAAGSYYGNDSGPAFCSDVEVTIGNQAGTVCYYPSQANGCPALSSSYTLTGISLAGSVAIGSGLAPGASAVIVLSTRLSANATDTDMGLQATQPFTWTLEQ